MKLLNISIGYFGGFCESQTISLNSPLVIFFGPNGRGKTTIAEALEWLFFRTTQRRLHSDVDDVEHRGALRNTLCPKDVDPFVEALVKLRDNSTHTLRRALKIDGTREWSVCYIDGNEVPDFTSLGLVDAEHFYPIIVHHNLQDLILSSGSNRRRRISCLLGLEPLISYESAVDTASNRFLNSLPPDIAVHYSDFKRLEGRIGQRGILHDLYQRWIKDQVEYPADFNEILDYCRVQVDVLGASPETIQSQAEHLADAARRAIFDMTPFAPKQNMANLITNYNQHIIEVRTNFDYLREGIANYVGARGLIFTQLQFTLDPEWIEFWRAGLGFLDVGTIFKGETVQCPFCEEITITREKIDILSERLTRTDQYTRTRNHLQQVIGNCLNKIRELIELARPLLPNKLDAAERERLTALLPNNPEEIQTFSSGIEAIYSALNPLEQTIQAASATLQNLLVLTDDPDRADIVAEFIQNTPTALINNAETFITKINEYSTSFNAFFALLLPRLSSDEVVSHFELIQNLVTTKDVIFVVSKILQMHDQLRQARQAVRVYLDNEDRNRIQTCSDDIEYWFNLLYGGEEDVIEFSGVDLRGTTSMRLLGNILGKNRYVSTHFSQSQLNCLGLAIHVVSATATDCPFDFVLFDDPVQSFDDEHRERLLNSAVPRLLDDLNKQIIVLTYSHNLADRLRYANERRGPLYHRFEPFSMQGIQVKEFNFLLSKSQEIRRRARGDDVERDVACQRLRTFVEHIIKAIYQVETARTVPSDYEDRTGSDLVILLESIQGFPRTDLDYIRETILFGQKPSHDDPDWHPPNTTIISQRMDRLEQICRNHRLNI